MYDYHARVTKVVDGDTLDLEIQLGFHLTAKLRVRLVDCNCPETKGATRAAGLAAKEYTTAHLLDRDVVVVTYKSDDWQRWLARVLIPIDDDGPMVDYNKQLVAAGHAVPFDVGRGGV